MASTARNHSVLIAGAAIHRPLLLKDVDANDWDDWRWGGNARSTGPTIPSFAQFNSTGIYCWQFANGKELHFTDLQLPHDYAEDTELVPHIHFCATSTTRITGTWTLDILSWLLPNAGTPEAKQTITYAFDVNPPTIGTMIAANFSANMAGTGRKVSSCAMARLSLALSSGDLLALLGLDAHYQKDRLGSRQISSKE